MRKAFIFTVLASMIIAFGATAQAAPIVIASGTGSQQTGEGVDAVNGVLTDGKCILTVRHAGEGNEIEFTYTLQCFDITGVTQAHIHTGTADGVGPVAVRIFGPVEGQDFNGLVAEGSFGADEIIDLTPEELNGLVHSDGVYLNVHTTANPPGEVRGQLVAVDDSNVVEEFFLATASGSQQRDETVATDASCLASFRVKGENLKYKVKCFNIDGVTQVHLHLGSAQSLGAPVAFLFPIGEPTGPINGKMTRANGDKSSGSLRSGDLLNDLMGTAISDLVDFMRTDGVYLNVHTAANPPGEVRGQITVVETLAGGF